MAHRTAVRVEDSPSPVYGAALLMRLGLTPLRGSNPRSSAGDQALCPAGEVPAFVSAAIPARCWHNAGTLGHGDHARSLTSHHRPQRRNGAHGACERVRPPASHARVARSGSCACRWPWRPRQDGRPGLRGSQERLQPGPSHPEVPPRAGFAGSACGEAGTEHRLVRFCPLKPLLKSLPSMPITLVAHCWLRAVPVRNILLKLAARAIDSDLAVRNTLVFCGHSASLNLDFRGM